MAGAVCTSCRGKGWIDDTTYVRTGQWCPCQRCHQTGLPQPEVVALIRWAVGDLAKPRPSN